MGLIFTLDRNKDSKEAYTHNIVLFRTEINSQSETNMFKAIFPLLAPGQRDQTLCALLVLPMVPWKLFSGSINQMYANHGTHI